MPTVPVTQLSVEQLPDAQLVAQKKFIQNFLHTIPHAQTALTLIEQQGGTAYLVGGAVRDALLGLPLHDLDIEVHGIDLTQLEKILSSIGVVNLVGKSFGVLKVAHMNIDWALPRHDESGRKPTVHIDTQLAIADALSRRDLTINAMAIDLKTFAFIDPFGGIADIQNKILRSPNPEFFSQDPLRLYRVMQFIGRFNMTPDPTLNAICASMDIRTVSVERVEMEFNKLFMLSEQPAKGLRWLHEIGKLTELAPELAQLEHTEQEPAWHPEGNVLEHTFQVVDAAAALTYPTDTEKRIGMYAALCHDVGKATTTKIIDGKIRSIGHDHAGVPVAKKLLARISTNKTMHAVIGKLVYHHMAPGQLVKSNAGLAAYKRLAHKLAPQANMHMLALLATADRRGRNAQKYIPLTTAVPDIETFIAQAQKAGVLYHPEAPIITGADLLDVIPPGPKLGEAIEQAYELQINKNITDKAVLKKHILS